MPTLLNRVRPGDMITADQWNLVVDAVNQLLQQPAAGTGVIVTGKVPAGTASEPIRIGSLLQIVGQNFGYSVGRTVVRFTGPAGGFAELTANDLQLGSSDTRLVLTVPSIPGVTTTNTPITLTVGNGPQSTAEVLVAVVPSTSLTGDIFVDWHSGGTSPNPNPNPVQAGAQADFAFQLSTQTTRRATFALTAAIPTASATVPAGLVASIQFFDANGMVRLAQNSVELQSAEIRVVIVRIPQIPSTWGNVTFLLQLTAQSGAVGNDGRRSITVGSTTPQVDPSVEVQQTGVDFFNVTTGDDETNPTNVRIENGTIKMRAGHQCVIAFNVRTTNAGTYDVTFRPKDGATINWSPQLVNSPITIPGNSPSRLMQIGVTAQAGSSATGTTIFRIKRQGATTEWSKEFPVQLLT